MKAISATVMMLAGPVAADAVSDAYKLCKVFQSTGMTSECSVSGGSSAVDVRIDTSGREASKICVGASQIAAQNGIRMAGWQLRIYSPFSGDHPLAVCELS